MPSRDALPRARTGKSQPRRTLGRERGRVPREPQDRVDERADVPRPDEHRGATRHLGNRARCITDDDGATRLRLHDDPPELFRPRRGGDARHENHMAASVEHPELRRLPPRVDLDMISNAECAREIESSPSFWAFPDDDQTCATHALDRGKDADGVSDTLLGNETPDECQHEFVVFDRLAAAEEDVRVEAEIENVDQSCESLSPDDCRRLAAARIDRGYPFECAPLVIRERRRISLVD